ncbi:MAG: hypothetical protein AB1646_04975 [Thermodesulfobacteriota bacterium]
MLQAHWLYRFIVVLAAVFAFFVVTAPSSSYAQGGDLPPQRTVLKIAKKPLQKAASDQQQTIKARAVCCVNLAGNRVLISRNADQPLPIASLTKLITALVTMESMPLDRKLRVPTIVQKTPKSVIGLIPGDMVSVHDLLHGLLMQSGNDCAETLARSFPGGRRAFVTAMNKKARSLRARHTLFYTPSGLDAKLVRTEQGKNQETVKSNVSTAREVARIAQVAFANNTIRSICLKRHFSMGSAKKKQGYRVSNTNRLLREGFPLSGGKTGFTVKAGHCLATCFSPGGKNLLIVVLGSTDHFGDTRLLYRRALKMSKDADKRTEKPSSKAAQRRSRTAG